MRLSCSRRGTGQFSSGWSRINNDTNCRRARSDFLDFDLKSHKMSSEMDLRSGSRDFKERTKPSGSRSFDSNSSNLRRYGRCRSLASVGGGGPVDLVLLGGQRFWPEVPVNGQSRLFVRVLAFAHVFASGGANAGAVAEHVSVEVNNPFDRRAAVVGELRIPDSKRERLPAVVIVNSTTGSDGRGAFYAKALNQAGIATLEIDMFQGRGIPASLVHNMPHVFQSLQYLANHPRIDGTRVGIMGFSYGAQVSLLTSSDVIGRTYGDRNLRFAAHLALYPQCWVLRKRLENDKLLKPAIFKEVTGRPVHILVGEKDDYDSLEGCRAFLAGLPAASKPHYALSAYEGATFAWDSRFDSAVYEAEANRGRGGTVRVNADTDIARQSREFALTYFSRYLGAN